MTDRQLPVAIVGMSVLLPGAADLDAYWRNLLGGTDAISEVPDGRWDADYYRPDSASGPAVADQVYCRRGGFVDELAEVEVTRFGIMPNSVPGTEPDQLIALHVAAAALADAGGESRLPDRRRVGVVLGRGGYLTPGLVRLDQRVRTAGQLVRTLGELLPDLDPGQLDRIRSAFTERLGPDSPESVIGLVPNLAASRVANRLDLRGPAYTVDAACASSLIAVDQAVTELASGRCDLMLAGGVHHCHDITLWSVFSQLRALSPSQRIRPFHRDADGILIGEGTGVVVLKRLADAERDGDRIYAVIRGTGVSSDGRAASLVNPDSTGQTHAVRQAWQAAGLDPALPGSIGLLEAHGTATPAGDAAELATLAEVFGDAGTSHGRAVIGSVKSMIGHTMPPPESPAWSRPPSPSTTACSCRPCTATTRTPRSRRPGSVRWKKRHPGRRLPNNPCVERPSTRSGSAASTRMWCWRRRPGRAHHARRRRSSTNRNAPTPPLAQPPWPNRNAC